ncbi:VOC family protein [Lentzea sp. CC55]|uniref:VOC family protein n=1 Tax=Lentzea sp. CC55 TaxID=2884909 RepID=UPI0027DF2674|nr:VOC family protein [Lentzea sp. CC55]MCG8927182.1 hypothetical protein [Lentzea sp. CC55]
MRTRRAAARRHRRDRRRGPGGWSLAFELERHFRRPAREGARTASRHLDVQVDDLHAAVGHAPAWGAVLAGVQPRDDVRVLFDPDGHPLCLFLG